MKPFVNLLLLVVNNMFIEVNTDINIGNHAFPKMQSSTELINIRNIVRVFQGTYKVRLILTQGCAVDVTDSLEEIKRKIKDANTKQNV